MKLIANSKTLKFPIITALAAPNSWFQQRRGAKTFQAALTPSTGGLRTKIKNCCYHQKDACSRQQCACRHICDVCGTLDYGSFK